ncbi:MAG: DUF4959 domain-containing protein [Dysgonamonadaceae bacterium]|jgi:hypothetical protein|nr:DUF4959 domain-containing protein [Dysgonamonadaceae bacterium]
MKSYKYIIPVIIAGFLFIFSCREEELGSITKDSRIPATVSNVSIERLPGAVKLTYDLPKDDALSYIKAECVMNGVLREVKSSVYQNTLTVQGFPDTLLYEVKLYSVNRSELVNPEPVTVNVKPSNPPFQNVFKNLELVTDFGGATVSFENPDEADLAITIMNVDSLGFWTQGETLYTKKIDGYVSLHNMDTISTQFGVYIRDRWNNMTDTLTAVLKPMFEKQLNKEFFAPWILPTDEPSAYGWTLPMLWDNSMADGAGFHTNGSGWPQWITIDLGVTAKLSRFRYWQRQTWDCGYADRNVKKMEIWGSENPNPDGSWDDSWYFLTTVDSQKPSGLPIGQLSSEDVQMLNDGEEFKFSLDTPPARYIRFNILETWSGAKGAWFIMEIAFWGGEQN